MRKLTEKQHTVLSILALRKKWDGALSGPEIGEMVFRHRRVKHGSREWAGSALKILEKAGFVERLGTTVSNAQCWAITEAGRKALEEQNG